ncbi:class I SAM-dependent methyltransferase [Flavobacteriales bacterium]|nr:class I SAM-dependent methyltransferase [Flavobacteriales bacterium]
MNKAILNKEVQEFINVNLRTEINKLVLKSKVFDEVENKEIAIQISGKLKSKLKLPSWFEAKNIYYPQKISIEQTSSELTADYKSSLVSGNKLIDLTGGFGVDDYYFSKQFGSIVHCEINEELSQITEHNFEQLGVKNSKFFIGDGLEYLSQSKDQFDCIYVDPSRRSEVKGKVFLMSDCLPDIPNNLDLLFSKSEIILMKTSPLIDISQGLKELSQVKEIHVVAVKNEVKELLWIFEKNYKGEVGVKTVNLDQKVNQFFDFELLVEGEKDCNYSLPQKFLYEPNSAIMKSGGFNQVGIQNGLMKLQKHSHMYTGDTLKNFPGRRFEIKEVISASGKELKTRLKRSKANVTTRNYPQKVEEIRKALKINDGGEDYLFFTTNMKEERVCLVCQKIN